MYLRYIHNKEHSVSSFLDCLHKTILIFNQEYQLKKCKQKLPGKHFFFSRKFSPLCVFSDDHANFIKNLKSEKMINIYEIFEKPLIKILAFMEIEGVEIDSKFLKSLSSKFEKKIQKLDHKIVKF